MGQSIVESVYFADYPNKSCEAKAVLACTRVARCFQAVVQRVVLALLNVAFIIIVLSPGTLQAATVTAASCSSGDVGTAVTAAQNGDTVLIPPGTCTWTGNGIEGAPNCSYAGWDHSLCNGDGTSKYLTIQGAGIGQTVIIDQQPKDGISDQIFKWRLNPNGLSRITGIEVRGSSGIGCVGAGSPNISISGTSSQFRLDHSKLVTHGGCPAISVGAPTASYVRGVLDHNYFDVSGTPGVDPPGNNATGYCIYIFHDTWGNAGDNGDNSWAQPDTVGTAEALFLEDNIFHNNQSLDVVHYCLDSWNGARIVVRNNRFHATLFDTHGADTSPRSVRQYEVYNNSWVGPDDVSPWDLQGNPMNPVISSRGGVGIVFNNSVSVTNGNMAPFGHAVSYFGVPNSINRPRNKFGFCDGTNSWDQNSNSTGRSCVDQTGAGYGDLLNTIGSAVNVTRGNIVAWPNQVAQPTYGWNNTINGVARGGQIQLGGFTTPIVMGTDLIDGVRPGYNPYTYPHPLTTGATTSGTTPASPTNLRVQ